MNPNRTLLAGRSLTPRAITVLATAAPVLAVAGMANAVLMHRQVERARRDPLTGLLTRTGWTCRAERILRTRRAVVVLLDLDDFKTVNDTHGHHTGDAALISTAHRLAAWCGTGGVAGRIGGDEFVAVLIDHGQNLTARIEQLHHELARPVSGLGKRLSVSASIGYTRSAGRPGADLSALLRQADAAMYEAKAEHTGHRDGSQPAAVIVSTNGRRRGRLGTARGRRIEVAA
jgi:diguanylate cyclase (GGDEF)-like protein